jgi:integrase
MARLLYGSGLRVLECCRLRVKDVDLGRRQIMVRAGKGAPECHALTPRGKAFPHEEAAPVAHRLTSPMVPFALVNPVRTTR